jgi:transporter family protein
VGWGVGSLFYKAANSSIHPIMVSTIVTLVYMVITPLPFLFMNFDKSVNTTGIWTSIVGGLLMCAGSMGYFYALRNGEAGEITTITALYPALTLLLSCLFMGETMSIKKGVGVALACASFYILSRD